MTAQFNDYHLPEKHERNLIVPVSPNMYRARIVQIYDPAKAGNLNDDEPRFLHESERGEAPSRSRVVFTVKQDTALRPIEIHLLR